MAWVLLANPLVHMPIERSSINRNRIQQRDACGYDLPLLLLAADGGRQVARLLAVPAELCMVATLDFNPLRARGKLRARSFDFGA